MVDTINQVKGSNYTYQEVSYEEYNGKHDHAPVLGLIFAWFNDHGYYGTKGDDVITPNVKLTSFKEYCQKTYTN